MSGTSRQHRWNQTEPSGTTHAASHRKPVRPPAFDPTWSADDETARRRANRTEDGRASALTGAYYCG